MDEQNNEPTSLRELLFSAVSSLKSIALSLKRAYPPKGWQYSSFKYANEDQLNAELEKRAAAGWELWYLDHQRQVCRIRKPRK